MLVEKHTATAALAATAVLASLTLCGPARAEAPDIRPLVDEIVSGSAEPGQDGGAPDSGDSVQSPGGNFDREGEITIPFPNAVATQGMSGNVVPDPGATQSPNDGVLLGSSGRAGLGASVLLGSSGSAGSGASGVSGASGSASAGGEGGLSERPLGSGGHPPAPVSDAGGARPDAEERGAVEIGNHVAAFGLDTGSVATACAGSAVAGSSAVLLGSATGSGLVPGLIGPGSAGSGVGSAAVGFGSAGGSSLVPGLVGTGSSGSALGSAAVGSAMTGSALLTCLLLLPSVPPLPELPLQFPSPPAPPAPALPVAPSIVNAPGPPAPDHPRSMPPSRRERPPEPALPEHHNALNTVILMTLLVVAAAAGRGRATIRRARL